MVMKTRRTSLATILVALAVGGCSGSPAPGATSGPTARPTAGPTTAPSSAPNRTSGANPGGWQGTITFHAVMNVVKDETSESGDPGSVYHSTLTTHDVTQADVTDTFTVSGPSGAGSVDLAGSVANQGTTLERYVSDEDKYNALGCHYIDEVGQELSGPWSQSANGTGGIHFYDDGTYTINMYASGDPQTGEMPPTPQLPKRLWETFTILAGAAKDCPPPGVETHTTEGPELEWASSYSSGTDANGNSVEIGGQLDLNNPGSVVDGSISFDVTLPKLKMTVTWHLVHDGPITL
jgi:hypothetical protein